ncbi:MAG TPA: FKBP-type peptidyl-prolyl cis-trans isomerase [Chthoniobacterales bacterium]|jgi:FKBP-type peptidyl-prolyl cis-trans isomerase FklB
MKHLIIVILILGALLVPGFAQDQGAQLKDLKDKASYSIGLNIGSNFKKQGVDLNPDALIAGVKDALSGKKPALSETEAREVMTTWSKELQDKQKAMADKNADEGKKFLEDNKKKEGVKTTASGLQYKVVKEGNGAQPKATDTVTVDYKGTLINGTEFDSSYKRGEPATFPLNGVIKGWTEGLQLMKAGGKYQFFIPADLAYGQRAMGPDIAPNSTLIFDVELKSVQPAPAAGASPAPAEKEKEKKQ